MIVLISSINSSYAEQSNANQRSGRLESKEFLFSIHLKSIIIESEFTTGLMSTENADALVLCLILAGSQTVMNW